jgi:dipeptidyl aminopeptidase/acylaminoacyl peptidase
VVDLKGGSKRNVSMFAPATNARGSQSWTKPIWNREGNTVYLVHDGKLWRGALTQERPALISQIESHRITEVVERPNSVLWTSDSGNSIIVLAHDDVGQQDGFYRIDLTTGRATPLLEQGQCYSCVSQSPHIAVSEEGGPAAYLAEDATHYPDLWLTDSNFTHTRRLTATNPEIDKYQLGKGRLIEWLSPDGESLKGALLLPADYEQGRRYPLLVWVYGGNKLSDHFDRFGLGYASPFNMQLFATHGYAVLLPDAPQSVGTPMLDVAKSVLPGINRAIELGIADPDRLGIFGHSNGGYSTAALIVQTQRFKAAIDIAGTANLLGLYTEMAKDGTAFGTAIVEHGQDALGGTLWELRDRYIENSPIFYLDRVSTPLLIVHGAEDTGVSSFLGDQLFIALQRLGKRVEYAKYQGEGHSPADWSYPNQLDLCKRMIAWFDSYLKTSQ